MTANSIKGIEDFKALVLSEVQTRGKLHFPPLTIGSTSIYLLIYKTEQCLH